MTFRKLAYGASAVAIMMSASTAVFAQETTGAISGGVYDAAGSPVAGATVSVTHVPTGTVSTTVTDLNGQFSARNLRVGGPFIVRSASSAGEAVSQVASIGIGTAVSVELVIAGSEASGASDLGDIVVTGVAGGGLRTSPRANIGLADIESLPSIGRDIRDFVRTTPFATVDPSNNDALSIGGQSNKMNAFLVDGVRQGDDFGLAASGFPTVRSPISISVLEAVSVDVAPYDVQYGSFTGGVINSVTKSGTNEFHGEVFYEKTDQDLQGDTFSYDDFQTGQNRNFDLSNSEFEEKTWGATLMGPIIQDKLFFVLNYEKFESSQPVLTGPTGSGAPNEVPGISQADVDRVRQITQDVYGYDPLDAIADELLTEDEKYFAKLDWNINDRHRAVVSYQQTKGGALSLNNTSTSGTFPSVGLLSSAYTLESNLVAYKAQLFSDWTDRFSTEFSFSRKEVENISSNLAGSDFAAFQVYLDTPGGSATGPRRSIRFGPERSRHANALTNDLDQYRFVGTYRLDGGHNLTFGYEREQVEIYNAFIQFANGEYEFASLEDFQNRRASSIGYQNAASNNKVDGGASFGYNTNTLFFQDEWQINPSLTVNAGLRYDWFESDDAPLANPLFQQTFGFASNSTIDGIAQLQPRFGFNWRATDALTVYGGFGRFQGGSPNVWVSNNFTNTGNLLGTFQCKRAGYAGNFGGAFANCSVEGLAALDNVDGFEVAQVAKDGVTTSANRGTGLINIIDPTFETPSIWKTSLGAAQTFDLGRWGMGDGWTVRAEYVHSEIDKGVTWVDLNLARQQAGTAPDGRPTFFNDAATPFSQPVLMLTNSEGGETDQFAISLSKDWYDGWARGLGFNFSYTYLDSTEVSPGTSSVALSNYQQVAAYDPNNLAVSDSNYEIEDAFKLNLSYSRAFFGDYMTRINLFGQRRSGLNFSYAFATGVNSMFGEISSQQRGLLYVPQTDSSGLVTRTSDPLVKYSDAFNIDAFNEYLQRTGLIDYAGSVSPRNAFKSPNVTTFDLHIEQELPAFFPGGARLSLYADIENIGNMLNDEWGTIQQLGFPFYSTDIVAQNCQRAGCSTGIGNNYQYNSIQQDQASQISTSSVWQAKIGVRYKF